MQDDLGTCNLYLIQSQGVWKGFLDSVIYSVALPSVCHCVELPFTGSPLVLFLTHANLVSSRIL